MSYSLRLNRGAKQYLMDLNKVDLRLRSSLKLRVLCSMLLP